MVSATTTAEASMTLTFSGDTVQIFGTVGPKDAPYSVQLDNGSLSTFNATKYKAYQQILLYYADNLGPGSHNVKITNKPALPGESLNINYALVDVTLSVHTRCLCLWMSTHATPSNVLPAVPRGKTPVTSYHFHSYKLSHLQFKSGSYCWDCRRWLGRWDIYHHCPLGWY